MTNEKIDTDTGEVFDHTPNTVPPDVVDAEKRCQRAEAEHEALKAAAKAAKDEFDAAVDDLRAIIKAYSDGNLFVPADDA